MSVYRSADRWLTDRTVCRSSDRWLTDRTVCRSADRWLTDRVVCRSIYTVTVEPCYYTDVLPQQPQDVHIMIPGPPDAPEIFLRSQDKDEFVIEWGEPRCYGGVKVKGYRVSSDHDDAYVRMRFECAFYMMMCVCICGWTCPCMLVSHKILPSRLQVYFIWWSTVDCESLHTSSKEINVCGLHFGWRRWPFECILCRCVIQGCHVVKMD